MSANPEAVAARVVELLRAGADDAAWHEIDAFAREEGFTPAVPGPAAGFREIGRELYWTHSAIPEYVRLQREQLRRYGDDRTYVRNVTGVLYDLASFTWPGWGDAVRSEDQSAGRDAARRCAALRDDPANADVEFGVTSAMAHWAVGAHALAAGHTEEARRSFGRARERNLEAKADDVIDRGYLGLVDLVEGRGGGGLASVLDELAGRDDDEEAAFIRDQLMTARDLFVPGGAS